MINIIHLYFYTFYVLTLNSINKILGGFNTLNLASLNIKNDEREEHDLRSEPWTFHSICDGVFLDFNVEVILKVGQKCRSL